MKWLFTYNEEMVGKASRHLAELLLYTRERLKNFIVENDLTDSYGQAQLEVNKVLAAVLAGEKNPHPELMPAEVKRLVLAFGMVLPKKQVEKILDTKPADLPDRLFEIVANRELGKVISANSGTRYPDNKNRGQEEEFDEAVGAEILKRSFMLRSLKSFMAANGFGNIGIATLAEIHPLAKGSLLTQKMVGLPHFFNKPEVGNSGSFRLGHLLNTSIAGKKFSFGFFAKSAAPYEGDKAKTPRTINHPGLAFDFDILDALTEQPEQIVGLAKPRSKKAATVLSGTKSLTTMACHDGLHNISMSGFDINTPDKPNEGPVTREGPAFEEYNRLRKTTFRRYAWENDTSSSNEIYTFMLGFALWQHIFKENPKVKEAILDNVIGYFKAIGDLRKELVATHDQKQADTVAVYFSTILLSQLGLMVSINDPDLKKFGTPPRSVIDTINKLNLPDFHPDPLEFQRELKSMLLPGEYPNLLKAEPERWATSFVSGLDMDRMKEFVGMVKGRSASGKLGLKSLPGYEGVRARVAMLMRTPFFLAGDDLVKHYNPARIFYAYCKGVRELGKLAGNEKLADARESFAKRTAPYKKRREEIFNDTKKPDSAER